MYLPLSVFKILRSLGMRERESPGEFWFLNREAVVKAINARFPPTAFQCFETQIRWRTPIGQDAEKAVRQYINTQQAVNSSAINAAWAQSHQPIHQLTFILDFTNFSFVSGGQRYTLNDLQELYPNPKVQPHANLSGIDLSGIRINHCVIRNVSLANANLDGSSLGGLHLENTFLTGASLRNARLGQLRFTNSSFAEVDISGAFLNAVQLDDHCIPGEFTFSEVKLGSRLDHTTAYVDLPSLNLV
ncbi:pentapeptide repeat-containing protein [Polynucleobacter sp. AP-Nickl1-40-C4]|uniref:pentapeptide repeat-containing protein n=1 Tax=Polynucleobacter sp. AP-Nickl1-40-C4 TaxID=3108275 RepID=UPI002B23B8BA|nr:pentapeptide repeat-containing protein [Polynucleobacter sp. AP-Nickl1-40-C4]MEA9569079.1 pentapeptide repeat-containing protein [Polynucleobacter sp. AP-Nickl1-40-C4]